MRLGLSTYTYTWAVGVPGFTPEKPLTAEGLIHRASDLGVAVVQIADNLPLESASTEDVERIGYRAQALGVDIELGTRGISPTHLRRYLALASMIGSPLVRVVVDTPEDHPSPNRVVDTLAELKNEFQRAGVLLAIENHDRFPSDVLREVVIALGSDWSGICLDTVNSFAALEDPRTVIETLAPFTVNLHIKDFQIRRAPHMMGFTIEGSPAGQGQLDIPKLLATVGHYRNDVTAVLELWTPSEPTLEATIAKERKWAESSVPFLQKLMSGKHPQ